MVHTPLIDVHKSPIGIYVPLPDDDPLYAAVGRVSSAWSIFEHHLDRTIAALSEVPNRRCACITAQMLGAVPRLNAIIALSKSRSASKALLRKIETHLNVTYSLADRRNRIVHDPLLLEIRSKTARRLTVTARKELKYAYEEADIKMFDKTRDDIREHIERFLTIQQQIYRECLPTRHKRS
jgi:hypothetical protein